MRNSFKIVTTSETGKKMQTVTKIITSSSMTTEESSEVVETVTEESSVQKKERVKSKKAKRGKENISVVSGRVGGGSGSVFWGECYRYRPRK